MELASCHFSGVYTFEVAARFSETFLEPWKREKESSKEETTMKEQDKGLKDKGKEDGRGRRW